MKKIYPNLYYKKVEEITIETLLKNKIKLLILDVDNTLIDYYKNLSEEVKQWAKEMKGQGIKLYILSNTNNKEKVEKVAKTLQIPYKHFAMKPLKRGFKYIQKETKIKPENILFIDDSKENIETAKQLGWNTCNAYGYELDKIKEKVKEFLIN